MAYTAMMQTPSIIGPSFAEFNALFSFTEPQVYIYGLHDPRTGVLRYIGKSIRPLERLGNHINEHSNTHRGHWLDELSRLGLRPVLIIIDSVSVGSDWQMIERLYIAAAREIDQPLTNGTDGGDGVSGLPAEVRARMAATWKGRKHSPETLALMSRNRRGRTHDDKWREHMSAAMKGRQFTPEHLRNLRASIRLTADQVREIRRRLAAGERQRVIAEVFGIHQVSVSNIYCGITYKDVR